MSQDEALTVEIAGASSANEAPQDPAVSGEAEPARADIQQPPTAETAQNQATELLGGEEPIAPAEPILQAVNPASVHARSPFRYPGGKTWLVPIVGKWLQSKNPAPSELIEPFAGGAIVGLSAAFERWTLRTTLVELDAQVASVWRTIFDGDGAAFAEKIRSFEFNEDNVQEVLQSEAPVLAAQAFRTLLRNRISRAGIIAPGAGILKQGENGKGLASRWYPETMYQRVMELIGIRECVRFIEGNGMKFMEALAHRPDVVWFIDPPYTVAGKRLYTHSEVDHEYLFRIAATLAGDFLMTYDETDEIHRYAQRHGFETRRVNMTTSHHNQKYELLIGRNLHWATP